MSKDSDSAVKCPSCHTPLIVAPAIGGAPMPVLREPPSPPPVRDVLAKLYAGRRIDPSAAQTGAARVRASLTAARAAASDRRARQAGARRGTSFPAA